jgi:hypothetical protein
MNTSGPASTPVTMMEDQSWNSVRCCGGTPSNSQITGDRQWVGERVEQVDLRRAGHRVEQLAGDLLDARRELLDAAAGERPGDQPAQPGVIRRVAVEHVAGHRGEHAG